MKEAQYAELLDALRASWAEDFCTRAIAHFRKDGELLALSAVFTRGRLNAEKFFVADEAGDVIKATALAQMEVPR